MGTFPVSPTGGSLTDSLEGVADALTGRYRIDVTPEGRPRLIGQGGMATVYLAQDLRHHRPVAIKLIRPGLSAILGPDRFLREIAIAARLNHPHILPLYDSGEAAGRLYYVMPFEEGGTLRDRLVRDGPLPIEEALRITREVASALDCAHKAGIVHRDIKPSNVLLSGGYALVADFGLARAVRHAPGDVSMTGAGLPLGTPPYMSPEQWSDANEVDGRSDIYSLGCVLYELLVGHTPFAATGVLELSAQHKSAPVTPLRTIRPSVSSEVETAVNRALAKVPADRFQTAGAFAEALSASGSGPSPQRQIGGETSAMDDIRPVQYRRVLGFTTLAVTAVLGGWWGATRIFGPKPSPSLVVLPLQNLSQDPGKEYVVEGVHDALIGELGQIAGLRVMSRTTAMSYKGSKATIAEIASKLDVDWVVEGKVMPSGDGVHIETRLLRAQPERVVWRSDPPERSLDSALILGELARAIAEQMGVTPTPQEIAQLRSGRPANPDAQDRYLRGLQLLYGRDPKGVLTSIEEFKGAIAIDPGYAAAYAALARAYSITVVFHYAPADSAYTWAARTLAAAGQAIELDPGNGLAYATRASMGLWVGAPADWVKSDIHQAIELQPTLTDPHTAHAYYLAMLGQAREAYAAVERAIELDPLAPGPRAVQFNTARITDDWERVLRTARQTRTFNPNFALAWAFEGLALRILGRPAECLSLQRLPNGMQAICLHAVGRIAEADSVIRLVAAGWDRGDVSSAPYYLVWYYALAGQLEEAISWAERAFERTPAGYAGADPVRTADFRPVLDLENGRFRTTVERLRRQAWERVLARSRTVSVR